jgi:hypothetical protein
MSIQGDVELVNSLTIEIKSLSKRLKLLRKQKREAETRITAYIRAKELPGVKHHGTAFSLEEKERRAPKANKQRDRDAQEVLMKYGIRDADRVLREIMEARKGDAYVGDKIKTTKY